jgi:hypothetical protein
MAGVLQPATTCSNSSRDRPNTPAASLLLLRIPLAPLLSHVLVSTPTNVAGRSPSNDQVRHKTPGHTRRRPHSRGAAPIPFRLEPLRRTSPSRRRGCALLRRLNDDSCTTNVVRNTAPATPPQAQQGWWLDQLIMRRKRSSVVRLRPTRQGRSRAPLWTGSRLPVADPRGPVSDSLRSLIDGARTVGASRRATRGLLELSYDVCSQSASITDVQAVRTCPVSDGFPVRERTASTGSPARAGATWCATTPRGGTLRSTGAAAGSLPRPASGPLRPVALSRCQQRAERLPQLS